jgi:uncharacterized membrane protein YkvA (DUF1232 family)
MEPKQRDFYQRLRTNLMRWLESKAGKNHKYAEYLMLAPDIFHLLCKLVGDKRIPGDDKLILGLAITYFISPVDILPEAILGPVGFMDDVALAAFVLNRVINKNDPEIIRGHWSGEGDVLEVVRKTIASADAMVGSGAWKKVKEWLGKPHDFSGSSEGEARR